MRSSISEIKKDMNRAKRINSFTNTLEAHTTPSQLTTINFQLTTLN